MCNAFGSCARSISACAHWLPPALVLLSLFAPPCIASRWQDVGNRGTSTDKIMVDTDSIQSDGNLRLALVMTVYPAPRTNAHGILMDRHVQKIAIDCANRTFIGIRTFGYLNDKQVGSNAELDDWKNKLIALPNDAMTSRVAALVCAPAAVADKPPAAPNGAPKGKLASGSGIVLNSAGDVLTNNHVVNTCKSITVKAMNGAPVSARVDAIDPRNDLAVLKTDAATGIGTPAVFRRQSRPPKLGESVGLIGSPLRGFLSSEPKATFGQINSVAGANNDYTRLQISAPAQPGNSGGPVLDGSGSVIGVLVSGASLALAAITGAVPQNVNFAIRGEFAQIFLTAHGVKFSTAWSQRKLETDEIASIGEKSTVLIVCARE